MCSVNNILVLIIVPTTQSNPPFANLSIFNHSTRDNGRRRFSEGYGQGGFKVRSLRHISQFVSTDQRFSAMGEVEGSQGIHETAKPRTEPMGEKTTGATSMFDKEGAIGKQFTSGGAIGGMAQSVGGPFHEQGAVGKQFTEQGSVGGSVQQHLANSENNVIDKGGK